MAPKKKDRKHENGNEVQTRIAIVSAERCVKTLDQLWKVNKMSIEIQ